jgi:hypothetical protein
MASSRRVIDPLGRSVVFDGASHVHLARRRPWLLDHLDALMTAVSHPDVHVLDPRPGRERFYRAHVDGRRWLRVVVDFDTDPACVLTAMVQTQDPRESP